VLDVDVRDDLGKPAQAPQALLGAVGCAERAVERYVIGQDAPQDIEVLVLPGTEVRAGDLTVVVANGRSPPRLPVRPMASALGPR
jgi:hypothetical protein